MSQCGWAQHGWVIAILELDNTSQMSTNTALDSILFKILNGTKLLHNTIYYKTCIQQKTIVTTSDDVIRSIQSRNYDIQNNNKSLNDAIH